MRQRDIIARIEALEKRIDERDFREKYTPLIGKRVAGIGIQIVYSMHMTYHEENPSHMCQGILEHVDADTLSIRDTVHPNRVWVVREAQELTCE